MVRLLFMLGCGAAGTLACYVFYFAAFLLVGPGPAIPMFVGVVVAFGVWWTFFEVRLFRRWLDRRRPSEDIARLKAYLETGGARVLSVEPDGVNVPAPRSPSAWRNYRAHVRLSTGEEIVRRIGLDVPLLTRQNVRDYDRPHRQDDFRG